MYKTFPLITSIIITFLLSNLGACAQTENQNIDSNEIKTQQSDIKKIKTNAEDKQAVKTHTFKSTALATFKEPWAMTFLPDNNMLITLKSGQLLLVNQKGDILKTIKNVPEVDYGGQGGLGDVILHPNFEKNKQIYLSYAEQGQDQTRGAAVARAKLNLSEGTLSEVNVIWRQFPKVTGKGHYGHRLAFDSEGHLFISSGERQKFDPSQDMQSNMGKILRLNDDGSIPQDNPFFNDGGVTAEIWSSGHRNPLGLAFDDQGRLWNSEMGPRDGDELNLVVRGENYGYPIVSDGIHYNGNPIPDHSTRPEFEAPKISWIPTIAPAELIYYSGDMFPAWKNSFFIAGLRPRSIIRVEIDGDTAKEVERFDMGERIRELEQGPDGAIWVLEDGKKARLLKLTKTGM